MKFVLFLNISDKEQEQEDILEELFTPKLYCNMEQELSNPKLPILGDAKMIFVDVHDFSNIFNMK